MFYKALEQKVDGHIEKYEETKETVNSLYNFALAVINTIARRPVFMPSYDGFGLQQLYFEGSRPIAPSSANISLDYYDYAQPIFTAEQELKFEGVSTIYSPSDQWYFTLFIADTYGGPSGNPKYAMKTTTTKKGSMNYSCHFKTPTIPNAKTCDMAWFVVLDEVSSVKFSNPFNSSDPSSLEYFLYQAPQEKVRFFSYRNAVGFCTDLALNTNITSNGATFFNIIIDDESYKTIELRVRCRGLVFIHPNY